MTNVPASGRIRFRRQSSGWQISPADHPVDCQLLSMRRNFDMTMVFSNRGWLITALIAAVSGMAVANAQSEARTQIQSVYDHESAASMKKDVKGMLAHYSPEYTQ